MEQHGQGGEPEADIIVDMSVGYGDFMQEFTERGGVVVSPATVRAGGARRSP